MSSIFQGLIPAGGPALTCCTRVEMRWLERMMLLASGGSWNVICAVLQTVLDMERCCFLAGG